MVGQTLFHWLSQNFSRPSTTFIKVPKLTTFLLKRFLAASKFSQVLNQVIIES
tara:strand:+ start:283 stop:441 length:159 start_codon:yes stop_codon:yes gene_type:complete